MSFDTLTTASINVMGLARAEAQAKGLTAVDVEHILLGLLAELSGIAYQVLKKNGLHLREARMQEHLLLALLAQDDCVARIVLEHLDVDVQQLRGNVLKALIMPKN